MLNFSFLLHLEIELLSFDVVNVLIRSHENKINQTSFFEYFKGGGIFPCVIAVVLRSLRTILGCDI